METSILSVVAEPVEPGEGGLMELKTKFNRHDRIWIKAIDVEGIIDEIVFNGEVLYLVLYWMNGELKSAKAYEYEIEYPKPANVAGLK